MKKVFFTIVIASLFFSCQKEETAVTQDASGNISKTSPLALLISRVSQNATHCDDVLDNSSCYSVHLPVTLTVDGQEVTVNNESDYAQVKAILGQSASDDDIIHFDFPITIVFADFNQSVINSQQQLDAVHCGGDEFNEIKCIDFVFPIRINTYNTSTQAANVVTIQNNVALYNFIHNGISGELFTIAYPVTLLTTGGDSITVSNNDDLENTIEDAIGDCDDNGGSGPMPLELESIIQNGTWHVSFCEGPSDVPSAYSGYNFTFLDSGNIIATNGSAVSYGRWSIVNDDDHLEMSLDLDSPALHGLENENWKVTEYNTDNFRLKDDHHQSGGPGGPGGQNDYVYFTKN